MNHSQLATWFRVVVAIGMAVIGAVLASPLFIMLTR
jgi:hypothetical protein